MKLNNEQICKFNKLAVQFHSRGWIGLNEAAKNYEVDEISSLLFRHLSYFVMDFKLPIDDYSLTPKMKRLFTILQVASDSSQGRFFYYNSSIIGLIRDEFNTNDINEQLDLVYYMYSKPRTVFSKELIDSYLQKDINKERIIKRNMLIKDELIQESHKIGGSYYKESLQEGLNLWNSHI